MEGNPPVLGEGAAFRCLGSHAGRPVMQDDGRFDLIAVLATRPTAACPSLIALLEQLVGSDRRRVA